VSWKWNRIRIDCRPTTHPIAVPHTLSRQDDKPRQPFAMESKQEKDMRQPDLSKHWERPHAMGNSKGAPVS